MLYEAPDAGIGHSLHTRPNPAGYEWGGWDDEEQDRDADVLAMLAGFDDADDEDSFWWHWLTVAEVLDVQAA